jgi:hypothetical protein
VLNSAQCSDAQSELLIQICNARDALHHGYPVCRRVTALTRGRSATSHYLDSSGPHSAQQLPGPYHSLHRVMIQHISGSSPVCARRRASVPLITGARTHRRPGRSMHGIDAASRGHPAHTHRLGHSAPSLSANSDAESTSRYYDRDFRSSARSAAGTIADALQHSPRSREPRYRPTLYQIHLQHKLSAFHSAQRICAQIRHTAG